MSVALAALLFLCMAGIGIARVDRCDDGPGISVNSQPSTPSTLALGSLTTTFTGDYAYAGNFFNITTASDMKITGLDLNLEYYGNSCDLELYVKDGTSEGFEYNSTLWTLEQTATIIAQGYGLSSHWDLSSWTKVFEAGKTYGICIYLSNYENTTRRVRYSYGTPTT